MSSWLFLLISTTLLKWVIDRRSYLFALNKKIEIKVHYIKDTRNLQSNLASFGHKLTRGKYFSYKISSKRWPELIKSAEFISYTIQDLHKKAMTNFERFKKKTHLLNLPVHRVPLHSECVGQLYRLFSRGSFCFCGLLLKVVDDSHSDPMLCTFWWGNTKLKTVKLSTPGWNILECKTWFLNAHSQQINWKKTTLWVSKPPFGSKHKIFYNWYRVFIYL